MTHETMSALLDGECSAAELDRILAQMDRDPSLAERYSRMVMAREARGSRIRAADPGFAGRVLKSLDQDPSTGSSTVIPFRRRAWVAPRFLAPAAGLALAAGVGALAVLALRPDAGLPAPATELAALDPVADTAATGPAESTEAAQRSWDQLDPGDAERLNAYLIAYSQSRAQQGMGSTLGYARYAAHTAEYRPQRIQGPSARPAQLRETR